MGILALQQTIFTVELKEVERPGSSTMTSWHCWSWAANPPTKIMIPGSWFGWDPLWGDLYKYMYCLNISSNLISFKCALVGLQEHLEECELRGEGQRKSDNRHCDLRGHFGSSRAWPGRTHQQMGNRQCVQDTLLSREGGRGKLEVLCSAGLSMLPVPISESGWGHAKLRDVSRPFSLLCRDFTSFPRCWVLSPCWDGHMKAFCILNSASDMTNFGST